VEPDSHISYFNDSSLVAIYTDPATNQQKVMLHKSLPGGATDVEFSLLGIGPGSSTVEISHDWPNIMYNIDSLFQKLNLSSQKAAGGEGSESLSQSQLYHPKILSLKKELENNRATIDSIPRTRIQIKLPIPVQTATTSYTFFGGKQPDGSMFVFADMTAYQNTYSVKKSDKKVNFLDVQ